MDAVDAQELPLFAFTDDGSGIFRVRINLRAPRRPSTAADNGLWDVQPIEIVRPVVDPSKPMSNCS